LDLQAAGESSYLICHLLPFLIVPAAVKNRLNYLVQVNCLRQNTYTGGGIFNSSYFCLLVVGTLSLICLACIPTMACAG
jgi:hypothetical protein